MRLIGYIVNPELAKRFSDYLTVQGIENRIASEDGGMAEVWVASDDMLDEARRLLADFENGLIQADFRDVATQAYRQRSEEESDQKRARRLFIDVRTEWHHRRSVTMGPLTGVLIAISVFVSIFVIMGKDSLAGPMNLFYITPTWSEGRYVVWDSSLPEIRSGQIWRLFTPMFLHFNLAHILFNMLWLKDLGSQIEHHKGTLLFALLVLVIAATSNLGQFTMSGPMFGGMSGVVYGLLGYIWMMGRYDPGSGLAVDRPTVVMMIIWFFVCLTGLVGPVANTAHGVGLVVGVIWGFVAARGWRRYWR